ncbi:hypothetical protein LPJ60_004215 [Coemansia sp. RSA 2675]|nr:hypothetical protein LPJ60_004215 [Coemansia sp. RSA 2675]
MIRPLGFTDAEKSRRSVSRAYRVLCIILLITGLSAIGVGGYFSNATGESYRVNTVTGGSLKLYIFMGVYMFLTSLLGIFASLAPLKRKRLLQAYIVLCALSIFIMMCMTIWLWTRTLNINDIFGDMWRHTWSDDLKLSFEDENTCCGYSNPKDSPVLASASCKIKNGYGCYLPVLFYTQIRLRGVYAGLVVFMLVALAATVTATLQLVFTLDHERVLRSQTHYLFNRMSRRDSAGVAPPRPDSAMSTFQEQQVANNGWGEDD